MAVLVLTFVSILLATFALVVVVTRQSADEKIVGERMAWIHLSQKAKAGTGLDSGQLLTHLPGGFGDALEQERHRASGGANLEHLSQLGDCRPLPCRRRNPAAS